MDVPRGLIVPFPGSAAPLECSQAAVTRAVP